MKAAYHYLFSHPLHVVILAIILSLVSTFYTVQLINKYLETTLKLTLDSDIKRYATQLHAKVFYNQVMGAVIELGLTEKTIKKALLSQSELNLDSPEVLEVLKPIRNQFDADSVFLVNRDGLIVSYQTVRKKKSTGKNVSWRPYFKQAMQGKENVYAAIGSVSNKRGLYFAAPVYQELSNESEIIGAIVIKIKTNEIEQFLEELKGSVLLLSPQGIVYLSNDPQWEFHILDEVTQLRMEKINALKQFGQKFNTDTPQMLPFKISDDYFQLKDSVYAISSIDIRMTDPNGLWKLIILHPVANQIMNNQIFLIFLMILLFIGLIFLSLYMEAKNRHHQELIKHSKQLLQKLTDSLPLGVFQIQQKSPENYHFTYKSRGVEQILGLQTSNKNLSILGALTHLDAESTLSAIKTLADSGKTLSKWAQDFRIQHPFLGEREIHGVGYPIQTDDQSLLWNGYWIDITEQKRLERELTEQSQQLHNEISNRKQSENMAKHAKQKMVHITNNIPGVVYQLQKSRDLFFFTYISNGIKKLHGINKNQAIENFDLFLATICEDQRNEFLDKLLDSSQTLLPLRFDYQVNCADDAIKWIHIEANPHAVDDKDNDILFFYDDVQDDIEKDIVFFGNFTDVTADRQAQEMMLHASRVADEANQAKSDFLANMSHEIRTPMNAIIGMSYLALQSQLTKKQHYYIENVNNSAKLLLGIINDILDFSKIEAGKLNIEEISFKLDDVLQNLSKIVSFRANEKGLELLFNISPEIPAGLIGDPLRLGQILTNLVTNAIKFTESGEIVINIQVLEKLTPNKSNDNSNQDDPRTLIQFSIQDSGIGLSTEQKNNLFQSFTQADSSTTRRYGGTGLGLVICKKLAEKMGGTIWLESQLNKGSTFHFTINFGVKEQFEKENVYNPHKELKNIPVLVVDDNSQARLILRNMLEVFGCKVNLAASGEEAISEIEMTDASSPYQLVLMDWKMSGMNGIETIRQVLTSPAIRHKPKFIIATAYGKEEVMDGVLEDEIQGFLVKPITPSHLFDGIMNTMGQSLAYKTRNISQYGKSIQVSSSLIGAQVLLVEDNEINLALAEEILLQAKIIVDTARDGEQAIQKILNKEYDAILMDINMPVMDGYEATKKLRKYQKYQDLPIIAMTANAMQGDKEKSLSCGMDDHIVKPIDVDQLFLTLTRLIKRVSYDDDNEDNIETKTLKDSSDVFIIERNTQNNLQEIAGINFRVGLDIAMGNEKLYLKLLKKFATNQQNFSQDFTQAIDASDIKQCIQLAHTLKGSSANIGAEELPKAAEKLEIACREEQNIETIKALFFTANESLSKVLTSLAKQSDQTLTESGAGTDAEIKENKVDKEAIEKLIKEIEIQVKDDNTEAVENVEQLLQLVNGTQEELIIELKESLVHYDFDAALEYIQQFIALYSTAK